MLIGIVITVLFVVILLRVFKLYRADGDLRLLSHTLKPAYFKDKVVWVTGASSGIGACLCKELSMLGAKVILSARSKDKLEEVKESLAFPENAKIVLLDLMDSASLKNKGREAREAFGPIDMLFCNAGISMRGLFVDVEDQVDRNILQVDYFGQRTLIKQVLPEMIARKRGHIIGVSSLLGKYPTTSRSSYVAAKYALTGLLHSIRCEVLDRVSITVVCPGPVRTNVAQNALNPDGTLHGRSDNYIESGMTVERADLDSYFKPFGRGLDVPPSLSPQCLYEPVLPKTIPVVHPEEA